VAAAAADFRFLKHTDSDMPPKVQRRSQAFMWKCKQMRINKRRERRNKEQLRVSGIDERVVFELNSYIFRHDHHFYEHSVTSRFHIVQIDLIKFTIKMPSRQCIDHHIKPPTATCSSSSLDDVGRALSRDT
jgi:hypothetical protein